MNRQRDSHWQEPSPRQTLTAEFVGTLLLTFVDAGGAMVGATHPDEATSGTRAAASGLTIMVMTYTLSEISGAHINPAITLAFALRGIFPLRHVGLYWLMQMLGAIVAAGLLRLLLGDVAHVGMPMPQYGYGRAVAMEAALTFLLVSVAIGATSEHAVIGKDAAIAMGGTVALCGFFSRPISGASMNPARSLGPAIVGSALNLYWIYLLGPGIGMVLAVVIARLMRGSAKASEQQAAGGKGAD